MSLLRTIRPLDPGDYPLGRPDHPSRSRLLLSLRSVARVPLEPVSTTPRAGRVGLLASHRSLLCGDALPVAPQPIEQGPGHGAVPSGMVGRFPEAPVSCSSRKAGLSDG